MTFDVAYIAEVGLMFLKMITFWRVPAGIVHPLREIKQGKSGKRGNTESLTKESEMRVVKVAVVLLYLREFNLVYVDEMTIKTGHYISHTSCILITSYTFYTYRVVDT